MNPPDAHRDDWLLVQRYLSGDPSALVQITRELDGKLQALLVRRGANSHDAADLLATVWADCVPGADDRPSLLEKYKGTSPLQGWLGVIATRRWIDLQRRKATVTFTSLDPYETSPGGALQLMDAALPAASMGPVEEGLAELLATSLQSALNQRPATDLFLLRLVHLHDVTQREAARLLGWTETRVSRSLHRAMQAIAQDTLEQVRRVDPWLDLSWQDFLDLCQTHHLSFLQGP